MNGIFALTACRFKPKSISRLEFFWTRAAIIEDEDRSADDASLPAANDNGNADARVRIDSRPLMTRLRELEAKQDEFLGAAAAPVDIPDIHPNVAGIYRRKVEGRAPCRSAPAPAERDEAADAVRALIDHITLTPGAKRGEIAATAWRPRHDPRMGSQKTEHSRPERLGSVGFGGCGGVQPSRIADPRSSVEVGATRKHGMIPVHQIL